MPKLGPKTRRLLFPTSGDASSRRRSRARDGAKAGIRATRRPCCIVACATAEERSVRPGRRRVRRVVESNPCPPRGRRKDDFGKASDDDERSGGPSSARGRLHRVGTNNRPWVHGSEVLRFAKWRSTTRDQSEKSENVDARSSPKTRAAVSSLLGKRRRPLLGAAPPSARASPTEHYGGDRARRPPRRRREEASQQEPDGLQGRKGHVVEGEPPEGGGGGGKSRTWCRARSA